MKQFHYAHDAVYSLDLGRLMSCEMTGGRYHFDSVLLSCIKKRDCVVIATPNRFPHFQM